MYDDLIKRLNDPEQYVDAVDEAIRVLRGISDASLKLSQAVGCKVLVCVEPLTGNLIFTKINRLSPSGRFVELSDPGSDIQCLGWRKVEDVIVHEIITRPPPVPDILKK